MDKTRIAHQMELERLYNKNQLIPRIRSEFQNCDVFDFGKYLAECNIPEAFGFDLLTQMVLHKRANLPTLVGVLRHHFNDSQATADMIYRAAECDLVDYNVPLQVFIMKFNISADVQEELDKFQFPLPMVVRPMPVRNNRQTGMLCSGGSIILRNNHHNDDVCLDHINRVNGIRFKINHDTAKMVKNKWRNLDKPKDGETREDFERRRRAFQKYDRVAHDVIDLLVQEGNEFYLTHKYDKRGRIYCQGYHVTYQGAPWNKAVIEFADKEVIE